MRCCALLLSPIVIAALPGGTQETAFISIDDMEGDIAARWCDAKNTAATTLEPDEQIVKEGELSGRWDPAVASPSIYLAAPEMPTDWTHPGALELFVHSEKATGAVFAIVLGSNNPATAGEDYYRCLVPVDWEGWRMLHLEPRSFSRIGEPVGWQQIDRLQFAIAGWNDLVYVPGTVLRFDAIRLTNPISTPERRVLFEPDTDWVAWWPLRYATTPNKTGRYVADWYPAEDGETIVNASIPSDWSGCLYLNLWLYCTEAAGTTIQVEAVADRKDTPGEDAYRYFLKPDWEEWQLVTLPLADFRRYGQPVGWQAIDKLRFVVEWGEEKKTATRFCLDDIWLTTRPGVQETFAVNDLSVPSSTAGAPTITAPGDSHNLLGDKPPLPTDVGNLLTEALAAKRAGNLELAFTKYMAVLQAEPNSVEAHWGLAWVLATKNEKEAAIEHFQKVVELSHNPQQVKEAKAALIRLKGGRS
ncbi:MAG: tetratricopeptide repeat protein [Candidatus Zipacnadales bacterium]